MDPRVWVGAPVYRWQHSRAVNSHRQFIAESVASGLLLGITSPMDQYITLARNECCRDALANDATHLLFLDDDTCPPLGALSRLLAHKVPVVGGLYFDSEFKPVAYSSVDKLTPLTREMIEEQRQPEKLPILQVEAIGMGFTLIETEVLRATGDRVWFQTPYVQGTMIGDDVFFCEILRVHKILSYVDVSLVCDHLKTFAVNDTGIV